MYIDTLEWLWYIKLKRKLLRILAIVLGLLSIIVVISESTSFIKISLFNDVTILGLFIKMIVSSGISYHLVNIVLLIPLVFMSFNVYYGIFKFNVTGFYGLYPNHNTDSISLLFTSINFSRVGAPLCLNFLNIIGL